jgi:hypothetical protein
MSRRWRWGFGEHPAAGRGQHAREDLLGGHRGIRVRELGDGPGDRGLRMPGGAQPGPARPGANDVRRRQADATGHRRAGDSPNVPTLPHSNQAACPSGLAQLAQPLGSGCGPSGKRSGSGGAGAGRICGRVGPAGVRTSANCPRRPRPACHRKCHEFKTDLGDIIVRQPRMPRLHKINMSSNLRSYTTVRFSRRPSPRACPSLCRARTSRRTPGPSPV